MRMVIGYVSPLTRLNRLYDTPAGVEKHSCHNLKGSPAFHDRFHDLNGCVFESILKLQEQDIGNVRVNVVVETIHGVEAS